MSNLHDSPPCAQRLTSTKPDTQGTHLKVSKIHALCYSFSIAQEYLVSRALLSTPPWKLTPPSPFSVTGKASPTNAFHSNTKRVSLTSGNCLKFVTIRNSPSNIPKWIFPPLLTSK